VLVRRVNSLLKFVFVLQTVWMLILCLFCSVWCCINCSLLIIAHLCAGELPEHGYKQRLASEAGISQRWPCGYSQSDCYLSHDWPFAGNQLGVRTRGFILLYCCCLENFCGNFVVHQCKVNSGKVTNGVVVVGFTSEWPLSTKVSLVNLQHEYAALWWFLVL